MRSSLPLFVLGGALLIAGGVARTQEPSAQERVAALKASLAASQVVLRQYEWIETTVVSLRGEEKSRQQSRCYHGADGGVQKVPLTAPPQDSRGGRGVRGRIKEAKVEELTDYMKEAVALVKHYVPPDPARIQASHNAGKVTLQPVEPGKRLRVTFADYFKPGDQLSIDLDIATDRLLGSKVSTYLDAPNEPVILDVSFGLLQDGTSYPAAVTLDAQAKQITVKVDHSGYRKQGG